MLSVTRLITVSLAISVTLSQLVQPSNAALNSAQIGTLGTSTSKAILAKSRPQFVLQNGCLSSLYPTKTCGEYDLWVIREMMASI